MLDASNIRGPRDRLRIERAGHNKTPIRPATRRSDHQLVKRRLPVGAMRADITKIPGMLRVFRIVEKRIHGTIQDSRAPGAVMLFQPPQDGTAGKREIQIELWNLADSKIVLMAGGQPGERDRRVDVIEGGRP